MYVQTVGTTILVLYNQNWHHALQISSKHHWIALVESYLLEDMFHGFFLYVYMYNII
jgi:hypothetical protein